MTITTTRCKEHGHPEFALTADTALVPEVFLINLAETIEAMVAGGAKFQAGETFQIGWMFARVQGHGDDQLTLEEPDMQTMPVEWAAGITHTLRHEMLQLYLLDSVGLRHEMQSPHIRQTLIACTQFTNSEFFMSRSDPTNERDSGWFLGCLDPAHDHNDPANLTLLSMYEAYLQQRGIQGFVSFPIGSAAIVEKTHGVAIALGDAPLDVVPGSYLDAWLKRRADDPNSPPFPA